MKISALEEYGLRCLLQLAQAPQGKLLSAEDIAAKEGLSVAYIEKILSPLRKANLIRSVRGMYGGYELTRPPAQIFVGDMVRALDGDFFSDMCHNFAGNQDCCVHMGGCSVRPVWLMVARHVYQILDHLSLLDLIEEENSLDRVLLDRFPTGESFNALPMVQEKAIY